jgi:hypothetical protein
LFWADTNLPSSRRQLAADFLTVVSLCDKMKVSEPTNEPEADPTSEAEAEPIVNPEPDPTDPPTHRRKP